MYEFSQPLGDVIKEGRRRAGLTQKDVSIALDMDYRTLHNIETGKGNPCMDKLYPLIRYLKVDSQGIFYPELVKNSPMLNQLRLLISDCTEEKADVLIPFIVAVLSGLRKKGIPPIQIE